MTTSDEVKEKLQTVAENQPKVYQAGVEAVKKELNTGIADEGKDNVVTGHSDTVELSEGNAFEERFFQELIKAGIIPEGSTEFTGGKVKGNNSIHSGSGFTDGDFNVNQGRGNYTNGKNAKAFGYEQFVDGQDSTGIGTMNIIRMFMAGFQYGMANKMSPDNNAKGVEKPSNAMQLGFYNTNSGESSWQGGVYNVNNYWNVFELGRRISSAGDGQILFGFNPDVTADTLFAVGDGDDSTKSNVIIVYKNKDTGKATKINIRCSADFGTTNNVNHKDCFVAGKNITTAADNQVIFGWRPAVTDRALFVVGDGNASAAHNVIVVYRNPSTNRASNMWINTKLQTEGNVESDKKVIAKQAPSQDNDCIRWQEYTALLKRVQDLEAKLK